MLSKYTGQQLPWGALTGIRPVKIAMAMLEEGKEEAAVRAHMASSYFASQQKIDLSIEIAKREKELLGTVDYQDGYRLYGVYSAFLWFLQDDFYAVLLSVFSLPIADLKTEPGRRLLLDSADFILICKNLYFFRGKKCLYQRMDIIFKICLIQAYSYHVIISSILCALQHQQVVRERINKFYTLPLFLLTETDSAFVPCQ